MSYTFIISSGGMKKSFTDGAELRDWLQGERSFAQATIGSIAPLDQQIRSHWKAVNNVYNEAINLAKRLDNADSSDSLVNDIQIRLHKLYNQEWSIRRDSAKGAFVAKILSEEGGTVAGATFLGLTKDSRGNVAAGNIPNQIARGGSLSALFEASHTRIKAQSKALEALREEASTEFREQFELQKSTFDNFIEAGGVGVLELKQQFERMITGGHADLNAIGVAYQNRIQQLDDWQEERRNFYEQQLMYDEPVKFWTKKAERHAKLSKWFGSIAVTSGVGFVFFIIYFIQEVLQLSGSLQEADYIQIITLTLVFSIGIWAIRIIVRLLLSNVHLTEDARERAVQIQTYLSLLNDESVSVEDKGLMLPSIFRSSSNGIVKDDSAPSSPGEFISRFFAR